MFVFLFFLAGAVNVFAQEDIKQKEEQEKAQLEAQEEVLQKQERALQAQERAIDARERAEKRARSSSSSRSSSRSIVRTPGSGTSFYSYSSDDGDFDVYSIPSDGSESVYFLGSHGSSSSNLNLSKTYRGETKENTGTFQVDESVRNINLTISGNVDSGSIKITILLSNGKVFKEVKLDDSADMNYSQRIRISEEEKKYYGEWKYVIKAERAEGRYMMQIQTH